VPPVEDLVSWHDANTKKNVPLSRKHRLARGVMVICYSCYVNSFRFDSYLADFRFVFILCFF